MLGANLNHHHTKEKSTVQPAEEVNPHLTLVGFRSTPGEIPDLAYFSWATSEASKCDWTFGNLGTLEEEDRDVGWFVSKANSADADEFQLRLLSRFNSLTTRSVITGPNRSTWFDVAFGRRTKMATRLETLAPGAALVARESVLHLDAHSSSERTKAETIDGNRGKQIVPVVSLGLSLRTGRRNDLKAAEELAESNGKWNRLRKRKLTASEIIS
ncbi:hypothetical protein WN48_09316 [Eufriesea mexicana]|nr:hypothetical protein WN48_09316 [Eufriesea mexicana]